MSHLPDNLHFVHSLVRQALHTGGLALDGTVGNGHDTAMLAEAVGPTGQVYGFDIQPEAIAATRNRLQELGLLDRAILHLAGHETLASQLPQETRGRLQAAVFNLGYLPGGLDRHPTQPATTLAALDAALDWLAPHGLLLVSVYPGHPGGLEESEAVRNWAESLRRDQFHAIAYTHLNRQTPPWILAVERSH